MDGSFIHTLEEKRKSIAWREVKIGFVSNSDNLSEYTTRKGEKAFRLKRKEYICYLGKYDGFKKYLVYLYVKNKIYLYKKIIIIGDGAEWIKTFRNEFLPNSIQILDFYHLSERVYEFANFVIKDTNEAKAYACEWCEKLKESKWKEVINKLSDFDNIKIPKGIINLKNYIYNNRDSIDYATYIKNKYFIGSGAIKSVNKFVTQARLKDPGMIWNKNNAQYLLSLRAKFCSGL